MLTVNEDSLPDNEHGVPHLQRSNQKRCNSEDEGLDDIDGYFNSRHGSATDQRYTLL